MMDELLQKVAEIRGMPASLVERSAKARAEKTGTTLEAVLLEWAGEDASAASSPAPAESAAPAAEAAAEPVGEEAVVAPATLTTDYLVKLAAEAKRMPPKLVLSSAEARAKNSKSSVDEVLADWAGSTLEEIEADLRAKPSAAAPPTAPAPELEPAPAAEPSAVQEPTQESPVAAAAGAMSMDELLDKVAETKGMPAALAKRSAEARAKKTGEPLEAVLAEWAGVDVASVSADAPSPAPPDAAEEPAAPAMETATDEEVPDAEVEVIEATAAEPQTGEAGDEAGARRGRYPAWLAAAFVLIPLLAVIYILVSPNGPDCGTGGQLLVDPSTGLAVNCDGSSYGAASVDYFAMGAGVFTQCAACHGADGGGGAGPAFAGGAVLATFPSGSCADHVEWVSLGTANWPDATYGATNKPVGGFGVMPSFGSSLSEEQLRAVVLYERVQFGGESIEEAEVDCGLVEAADSTEASAP